MNQSHCALFRKVRLFSSGAVALSILLSVVFSNSLGRDSLNWQIVMAAIALAAGVPHGALDHLVTLKNASPVRMSLFIILYIAATLIAVLALMRWNVWGFSIIVVMSSVHFGIGDSAFIAELDRLENRKGASIPVWAYAGAGGLLPVVIPLASSRSTDALERINSNLINWHHGFTTEIQIAVAVITTLSLMALIKCKRYRDVLDIALLAALAALAPPLVAFSVYFGCWHAMRHTARLTSILPSSLKAYERGRQLGAFKSAVIPGLPALIGTIIFVLLLTGFSQQELSGSFLWLTLVTIWSLTVPHMIVTARLDLAAFKRE